MCQETALLRDDGIDPKPDHNEAKMTQDVPNLLEIMNQASMEVNRLESALSVARCRYEQQLRCWRTSYEELKKEQGVSALDLASPLFRAESAVEAAAQRVQRAAQQFATAMSSRHAKCLEAWEEAYADSLQEYQKAQDLLKACQKGLGNGTGAAVKRLTLPRLRQLHQHRLRLASEQKQIQELLERVKFAKEAYRSSMSELESISAAVHELRRSWQLDEAQ
eukprot:gb/GFBE01029260.1/.p1 GENE.gb/GFBE01029260.1/~~gb/GFBE01029260.1/.p1  ORF type:complete len:221 (+),score=63.59 gb/GFBE01029260.1/:1-663(+)